MTFTKSKNPGALINAVVYGEDADTEDFIRNTFDKVKDYISDDMLTALRGVDDYYNDETIFEDVEILREKVKGKKITNRVYSITSDFISDLTMNTIMSNPLIDELYRKKRLNAFKGKEIISDIDTYECCMSGYCDCDTELTIYGGLEPLYEVKEDDLDTVVYNYKDILEAIRLGRDLTNK